MQQFNVSIYVVHCQPQMSHLQDVTTVELDIKQFY